MKLEIIGSTTYVTLSRRNLLTLLAKLDGKPMKSACTISKDEGDHYLYVIAEEDDVHYNRPEGGPGEMHPDTEEEIRKK